MSLTGRRAATLPELVVALVLLGLLGALLTRGLLEQSRATRAILARAEVNQTLEQASGWLRAELGEFGRAGAGPDLYRIAPESLSYRAPRGAGLACHVARDEVHLLREAATGWRMPQAGRDSLLLLLDPDSAAGVTGQWLALPISTVSGSACGGRPTVRLGTVLASPPVPPDTGTLYPVRTFEVMQAKLYRSQGSWWLGARSESAGEVVQPVAGPLAADGLRFAYQDSQGAVVSSAGGVRRIEARLAAGAGPIESTRVVLVSRGLE